MPRPHVDGTARETGAAIPPRHHAVRGKHNTPPRGLRRILQLYPGIRPG
ncbi:MAG TPA: hypothetical protein VN397_01955 [Candidatus Methylomirabilis sp.]|nr:hypothetical protein [Candidatus Methylomirabilis sp.]